MVIQVAPGHRSGNCIIHRSLCTCSRPMTLRSGPNEETHRYFGIAGNPRISGVPLN